MNIAQNKYVFPNDVLIKIILLNRRFFQVLSCSALIFFGSNSSYGQFAEPPYPVTITHDVILQFDAAFALFGNSVAYAGDINGDGYDDIIIGIPKYSNGELNEGAAVLYYGSPTGPSSYPDWIFESNQEGAELAMQ